MTEPERNLASLPIFTSPVDPATVWGPPNTQVAPAGPAGHLLAAAGGSPSSAEPPPTTPAVAAVSTQNSVEIDWATVAQLREAVSKLLASSIESNPNLTDADQRALAQTHINEVIRGHNVSIMEAGGDSQGWTPEARHRMAKAIMDALFGLGRLQPLVEEHLVENIDIYGYDNVWVEYAGGTRKKHPPIASSDSELMDELRFLAARGGESGRPFSATYPILSMDLPGGIGRLEANAPPISPRPKVVLRIHRLVDIGLDDLVAVGTLTNEMVSVLSAAVKVGCTIVVVGAPKAGKTTLVRALCNEIDPEEPIVTIEKERELHLDKMGERHLIVTPLQYRPGQGERAADGTMPGEVTLVQLLESSLRLNTERIVVGEVRGGEIDAMFQAMQAGIGSLSTLHASSATDAIERMATLTQTNLRATDSYAYRQIAQHIDLIVFVKRVRRDGRWVRMVTEIAEIQPGEDARPSASMLFELSPVTGQPEQKHLPSTGLRDRLIEGGLDAGAFRARPEVA